MTDKKNMRSFLCIDLEATCLEGGTLSDMEAIEIGVVALWEDGSIIDTFQSFIKPSYTELTDYATSIHNITQVHLDGAEPLPAVLNRLQIWLFALPAWPVCWYSWGTYDRDQLELDTGLTRANIPLPLPEHRNAKKLFQKRQLKKGRQVGLGKALELMGLRFDGEPHSALDDARNMARLFGYFQDSSLAVGKRF